MSVKLDKSCIITMEIKWYLASMTKLNDDVFNIEAVKGDLSLDDKVKITQNHYRTSTLPELSNTKLYPKCIPLQNYYKLYLIQAMQLH